MRAYSARRSTGPARAGAAGRASCGAAASWGFATVATGAGSSAGPTVAITVERDMGTLRDTFAGPRFTVGSGAGAGAGTNTAGAMLESADAASG